MRKRYNARGLTRAQFLGLTGILVVMMGVFVAKVSKDNALPEDSGEYVAVSGIGELEQTTEAPRVQAGVTEYITDSLGDTFYVRDSCYNDPNNFVYPYNTMSADWGAEIYEGGYRYYTIPKDLKDRGGCLPEVVQVYLWSVCKNKGVDYYLVLALIERESKYKYDALGDNGDSKGYMQINEKWHIERMEKVGATDLLNPYQNIEVGVDFLAEIIEEYGSSGDNCVLMVYNMGATTAKKYWSKGIYSTEYTLEITGRAQEIKQELQD